jgi:hypothetical protein
MDKEMYHTLRHEITEDLEILFKTAAEKMNARLAQIRKDAEKDGISVGTGTPVGAGRHN